MFPCDFLAMQICEQISEKKNGLSIDFIFFFRILHQIETSEKVTPF
jgi:hypothetical protein